MTENGIARERATNANRRLDKTDQEIEEIRRTHSKQVIMCTGQLAEIKTTLKAVVEQSKTTNAGLEKLKSLLGQRRKDRWVFYGVVATGAVNVIALLIEWLG